MEVHLDDLLDKLEAAHNERSLRAALRTFTDRVGFDYFAFLELRGRSATAFSDYPEAWQSHYLSNGYSTRDPVVTTARRSMKITRWAWDDPSLRRGSRDWSFFHEAAAFGLRFGFSIPIRVGFGGTSILAFASDRLRPEKVRLADVGRAHTAVAYLHLKLDQFGGADLMAFTFDLSPRETLCLTWASFGKTMKDTAALIGIGERTVRGYLEQARDKLGARDIKHAIRIALENGLI